MSSNTAADAKNFEVAYLVLSGTSTAARCPELLRELVGLGFSTVIAIPTPNASRVVAPRELADVEGTQVVQSYFDLAIRPRPSRGVVLFAPCSFNSLNNLAIWRSHSHFRRSRESGNPGISVTCPWVPAFAGTTSWAVRKSPGAWISVARPSRRPLRGLLRMRNFRNSIKGLPHAEERSKS